MTTVIAEPTFRELTGADRCDRCGGKATAQAQNKDGRELLLCANHIIEHFPALDKQGWLVKDDSVD
jgi:hypothetical protein